MKLFLDLQSTEMLISLAVISDKIEESGSLQTKKWFPLAEMKLSSKIACFSRAH